MPTIAIGTGSRRGTATVTGARTDVASSSRTWALVPPKPNPLTAARRGRARSGQASACVGTRRSVPARSTLGLSRSKLAIGGITPRLIASTVLISAAAPAPVSRCPTLALTAPRYAGPAGSVPRSWARLVSSTTSPTGVPVAWHSIRSTSPGCQSAPRYADCIDRSCPSVLGASRLPSTSLDSPTPRTTAQIRSPSCTASSTRLSTTTAAPSPTTSPSPRSSNGEHRPVGDSARS